MTPKDRERLLTQLLEQMRDSLRAEQRLLSHYGLPVTRGPMLNAYAKLFGVNVAKLDWTKEEP